MIKIHSQNGKVFEGEVFAIDPITKSIVIKIDGTYSIFNPAQITKIDGDLTAAKLPPIADLGISIGNIEKRETAALKQAEKAISAINYEVDHYVQSLFDKISILFPCVWDKTTIVVLDEYLIEAPYTTVKVKPNKEGKAIDRVTKILEGERKKLKLET